MCIVKPKLLSLLNKFRIVTELHNIKTDNFCTEISINFKLVVYKRNEKENLMLPSATSPTGLRIPVLMQSDSEDCIIGLFFLHQAATQ